MLKIMIIKGKKPIKVNLTVNIVSPNIKLAIIINNNIKYGSIDILPITFILSFVIFNLPLNNQEKYKSSIYSILTLNKHSLLLINIYLPFLVS